MVWPFGGKKGNKVTGTNVIPFRHAERPEVLARLRRNASQCNVRRPIYHESQQPPQWRFEDRPWQTADEVLWQVRKDINRGLMNPTSILVAIYDAGDERMIWYQLGFTEDEIKDAFDEWLDGL